MTSFKVLATNHTSFTVSDLDRTVAFFVEALGFELISRAPRDPDIISRITGVEGADIEVARAHIVLADSADMHAAVEGAVEGQSVRSVERKLGTGQSVVYGWVRAYNADPEYAFPGQGKIKPPERQLRDLKRELERVKRERDILKKAVAIFSKDPDRYSGS